MPIDSAELFKENLAQLNADELMRVTHHVTEPGETLASLAARYGTNVMTLRMLNGLADGPLAAGTDLRVPSGSTQLPPKVMLAAARVDGPAPAMRKKRGKPEVHVVRRGESIWTIARRNNMDPRTLMRLNGKSAKDKLRPGERLVLSGAGGGGLAECQQPEDGGGLGIATHFAGPLADEGEDGLADGHGMAGDGAAGGKL
jgi:membrane-bound lytic murein transglycosylase D